MDSNDVKQFIKECKKTLSTGDASELSYRSAFENLFKKGNNVFPINDPKVKNHNKPDFKFVLNSDKDYVIGYAEMKDIDKDLDAIENTEQIDRYKTYKHLFLTNGLDWRFFIDGVKYFQIEIAHFNRSTQTIKAITENFETLANQLCFFFENSAEPITSGKRLAEIMGNRARLIRDGIMLSVVDDAIQNENINAIYNMFKALLVSDLEVEAFADMYAQTLVYGLFIARFNDPTPADFSRLEARDLIPNTNQLLRNFFDHIAGVEFDFSLQPVVDSLCQIFCVSDIADIVKKHVNTDENDYRDPIIHFYEDFLESYDPQLKKKMGAYYTPTPVVKYIIKAVDESLKNDFNCDDGLANSETTTYTKHIDEGYKIGKGTGKTHFDKEITIPKVQILDPAVGTGTFLNEIVRFIYKQHFANQRGAWNDYVNNNLIPRLNGFEIMITPYTIAHLKIGMTLQSLDATIKDDSRLRVFLTNTLTEGIKNDLPLYQLFGLASAVTKESELAAEVKTDYPVMVVIGNPPYSISSTNKSEYILNLLSEYKNGLNEQKINLDDDYIKFIRFAEKMIEENKSGIVAVITNNSYLGGINHRQMRKHLLKTFDKLYIVNLHGNSRKQEKTPEGDVDENVFDIMQGVSIAIMVKNNKRRLELGKVMYADLYGKRDSKFKALNSKDISFKEITPAEPFYFLLPKNDKYLKEYLNYINLNELFLEKRSGFRTGDDTNEIAFSSESIRKVVTDLITLSESEYRNKYQLKDGRNHFYAGMKADVGQSYEPSRLQKEMYRPFDCRWTYYSTKSSGFVAWPRYEMTRHLINHDNLVLLFTRVNRQLSSNYFFCTNIMADEHILDTSGDSTYHAPLYLYDELGGITTNFNTDVFKQLTQNIKDPSPEDVFDYIYATLYSISYQKKFADFLDIDYPRIPIPSIEEFNRLVPLGRQLRNLHLMNRKIDTPVTFDVPGDNVITKVKYESNSVFINKKQCFSNISETAWNFYIGGFQPAQKWLKDREDRKLSFNEISHYEQIIAILNETARIMQEIG